MTSYFPVHFLVTSDIEVGGSLLAICISFANCLFMSLAHFSIEIVIS